MAARQVEPAFAEDAVDELDRHVRLGVVAIEAQDGVVGAVDLLDVAGDEDVEVAVVVVVAPLRFAVLDREGAENVLADEDAVAVVAEPADESVLGQRRDVDHQQVEVLVAVEVGPAGLGVVGLPEVRRHFGEQPAAAAVGAVVAHQGGVRSEGDVVPDRRQQEVEVAVVVVVRPGDRAQVEVGLVVVLPVPRQDGVARHERAGVVAVEDRLAVAADREILVAVAVHVTPGEVRGARGQGSQAAPRCTRNPTPSRSTGPSLRSRTR